MNFAAWTAIVKGLLLLAQTDLQLAFVIIIKHMLISSGSKSKLQIGTLLNLEKFRSEAWSGYGFFSFGRFLPFTELLVNNTTNNLKYRTLMPFLASLLFPFGWISDRWQRQLVSWPVSTLQLHFQWLMVISVEKGAWELDLMINWQSWV